MDKNLNILILFINIELHRKTTTSLGLLLFQYLHPIPQSFAHRVSTWPVHNRTENFALGEETEYDDDWE